MAALWPRAGRLGVHSALSLPLLIDGDVIGALNANGRNLNSFLTRCPSKPKTHRPARGHHRGHRTGAEKVADSPRYSHALWKAER